MSLELAWNLGEIPEFADAQRRFIITSVQGYGHVARDPRNAGLWSWVCEGMGV